MRPKIVLFGDSITEESFAVGGWGACLANHFCRTADVVLRGYSGYNTKWALQVVDRVLSSVDSPPAALIVFFGANDASLPDRSSAFQHVPLQEYRQNLIDLISHIKARWGTTTLIVLLTPPPIDEDARLRDPYGGSSSGQPERTNQSAGLYAESCISASRDSGVPVVDLWSKMQTIPGWEKVCLRDGLHLTTDGNKMVFDEVVETLKREGLSVQSLPSDLPLLVIPSSLLPIPSESVTFRPQPEKWKRTNSRKHWRFHVFPLALSLSLSLSLARSLSISSLWSFFFFLLPSSSCV